MNSVRDSEEVIAEEEDVFRQFDVVSDFSDHFYADNKNSKRKGVDHFINLSRSVQNRITKEWKVLEPNLPHSIFVRVYEGRVDLMRVSIIGAKGTPYHDGLFFFDIAFPSDYPLRPPLVHYRSFGLRLNPNLYSNGVVCLSLINTWKGNASQTWNPGRSTVLQLLVSLQALVLNEKPYYNEPMRQLSFNERKSSHEYNEMVFVKSCKTMMYLLRDPPKNFEGLVARHFKERASIILSACKAYANGHATVGYYDSEDLIPRSSVFAVSSSFKKLMAMLYPQLFAVFQRNGGTSLVMETEPLMYVVAKEKEKKTEIARRVFQKLKKFLRIGIVKESKVQESVAGKEDVTSCFKARSRTAVRVAA